MRYSFRSIMLTVVMLIAVTPSNIYAYINPGIGSSNFQVIIAFWVTLFFALKIFFEKIKLFLKNLFYGKRKKNIKDSAGK